MRPPLEDAWHVVYCILLLQGIGQLFPWNVFINAEEYFSGRFCGSVFEDSFEDWFTLVFNIASVGSLLMALRYQDRWSLRVRILGSLAVCTSTLVASGVLVLMEGASSAFLFFFTVILVFASGLSAAILQGGFFSIASALPPSNTQAMMAGQALSGLFVSLAALFTTLACSDDTSCITEDTAVVGVASGESDSVDKLSDRLLTRDQLIAGSVSSATSSSSDGTCTIYTTDYSTLVYFGIAVAVLVACTISYTVLERLPLMALYVQIGGGSGTTSNDAPVTDNTANRGGSGFLRSRQTIGTSTSPASSMHKRLVEPPPTRLLSGDNTLRSDSPMNETPLEHTGVGMDVVAVDRGIDARAWLSFKLAPIYREALAVFLVFTITFSVFPGATSLIVSSRECLPGRSRFFASDVFVLFSFVSFNTFNLLGIFTAGFKVVLPSAWLPTASWCRIIFVPLFLMCRSDDSRFPALLTADAFPLTIMPVFAFTHGYVGILSMMTGSQKSASAGTAMVLCLNFGILAGCILSFLVLFVTTSSS